MDEWKRTRDYGMIFDGNCYDFLVGKRWDSGVLGVERVGGRSIRYSWSSWRQLE